MSKLTIKINGVEYDLAKVTIVYQYVNGKETKHYELREVTNRITKEKGLMLTKKK